MKSHFSFLLLVLAVSCSSGSTKKEETSAFNDKVAQEKLKSVKELKASSDTRIPLQAGQWVKILTVSKGEDSSQTLTTFKVIKVAGKTVTMEIETTNSTTLGLQVMQYEVENYPTYKLDVSKHELTKLVEKMNINKIIMKQGNEPAQEISTAYMPMAKSMLKQLFASGYRIGNVKKEPCSSDYLKSNGCRVFEFEASANGFVTKGTSYAHSEVPVVGFIKSIADKSETHVLNFGLTGAKSSL